MYFEYVLTLWVTAYSSRPSELTPDFWWVRFAHLFWFSVFCLSLSCVLCAQCCQCLWIVHSRLPIRLDNWWLEFFKRINVCSFNQLNELWLGLIYGCLMLLSTIFHLCVGNQFYLLRNLSTLGKSSSHWQIISLQVVSSTPGQERESNSQILVPSVLCISYYAIVATTSFSQN